MSGNVYEPVAAARRMMRDMESMGSPANDPVFMAAARRAVRAGGGVHWDDLVAAGKVTAAAPTARDMARRPTSP